MTTTRYREADAHDMLWPEDRIETLLPARCFDAEPAGERYMRLLRSDAPGGQRRGQPDDPVVAGLPLCRMGGAADRRGVSRRHPRGRPDPEADGNTRRLGEPGGVDRGAAGLGGARLHAARAGGGVAPRGAGAMPAGRDPQPVGIARRKTPAMSAERLQTARAGRHAVDENPGTAEASPGQPRRTNRAEARRRDRARGTVEAQKEPRHRRRRTGEYQPVDPRGRARRGDDGARRRQVRLQPETQPHGGPKPSSTTRSPTRPHWGRRRVRRSGRGCTLGLQSPSKTAESSRPPRRPAARRAGVSGRRPRRPSGSRRAVSTPR